jgi:ketosteroid isomerase-like protein
MSQEIELAKRCLDAYSRRDIDALRALNDPEGIEVVTRGTFVITFHNQQVIRICLHEDTDQALGAVGLLDEPSA